MKYDKIISSFFLKSCGEKKFVKSVNFLPANVKSINPMQKYPHITESFAYTRKMLAFMILFPIKKKTVTINDGIFVTK